MKIILASLISLLNTDGRPNYIHSYVSGIGGAPGYQNPETTLTGPARMTSEGAVTPFQPAYEQHHILSLGLNGEITLAFNPPILNDYRNEGGVDFIIYGNSFTINTNDSDPEFGPTTSEGGCVEVSDDGKNFYALKICEADGGFPTLGWSICDAFNDFNPENPTDPRRPINPSIELDSLIGNSWEDVLETYSDRAGGYGYDLKEVNLQSAHFVRIHVPETSLLTPEIDVVIDTLAPIPEDFNNDSIIGTLDLLLLIEQWGQPSPGIYDVNEDGTLNTLDILQLLGKFE